MLDELHRVLTDFERRVGAERRYGAQVYSFPQVWGDSSLGFGGPAAQAITTAQTHVIVADYGPTFVYFGGRFAYEADARQAMEWVRALRCPDVRSFHPSAASTPTPESAQTRTSGGAS